MRMSLTTAPLPRWDMGNVYPGIDSEDFARDLADLGQTLDQIDHHQGSALYACTPKTPAAQLTGRAGSCGRSFQPGLPPLQHPEDLRGILRVHQFVRYRRGEEALGAGNRRGPPEAGMDAVPGLDEDRCRRSHPCPRAPRKRPRACLHLEGDRRAGFVAHERARGISGRRAVAERSGGMVKAPANNHLPRRRGPGGGRHDAVPPYACPDQPPQPPGRAGASPRP